MSATNTADNTTQTIYYWQDGYWVTDKDEADLMDSINAFGSQHRAANLPNGATDADIKQAVKQLLGVDA